jgi:hypothetical protein
MFFQVFVTVRPFYPNTCCKAKTMKLLREQFSVLREHVDAEIGSPFSDRSSPTFSAALWQFIKTWAMFGAVPNG